MFGIFVYPFNDLRLFHFTGFFKYALLFFVFSSSFFIYPNIYYRTILSKILGLLAEAKIGIAAVSTYNTDYIFVKETDLGKAVETLAEANYKIIRKGGAE